MFQEVILCLEELLFVMMIMLYKMPKSFLHKVIKINVTET